MERTSFSLGLSDLICGAISGVCFFVSGQPFEYQFINLSTVKVRMQMNASRITFWRATKEIFQKEGVRAYYKGMLSPILVGTPANALLFLAYENCMRWLVNDSNYDNKNKFLLKEWIIAGGFAGLVYGAIICPTEMIKIVLQMQFEYLPKQYNNPRQCIADFYRREGLQGLFKGMVATQCRDIPQNAAFFTTFEVCKYYLLQFTDKAELGLSELFVAGALSGLACSSASYPFDNIKTHLQTEIQYPKEYRMFPSTYKDGGVLNCSQFIYKKYGFRGIYSQYQGFFIGYLSCTIYQIVGSSAQFASYEQSKYYYEKYLLKDY